MMSPFFSSLNSHFTKSEDQHCRTSCRGTLREVYLRTHWVYGPLHHNLNAHTIWRDSIPILKERKWSDRWEGFPRPPILLDSELKHHNKILGSLKPGSQQLEHCASCPHPLSHKPRSGSHNDFVQGDRCRTYPKPVYIHNCLSLLLLGNAKKRWQKTTTGNATLL